MKKFQFKNYKYFSVFKCKVVLILFTTGILFGNLACGQTNTSKVVEPPYLATTSTFLMALFDLDKNEVQNLLPNSHIPKINERGFVTGGLEVYKTEKIYDLPNYTVAFITVEIAGYDADAATLGKYIVWGVINDLTALKSFTSFYNFPYSYEPLISIENKGNKYIATIGSKSKSDLSIEFKKKENLFFSASGIASIVNSSAEGHILKTELPWLSYGYQSEILSLMTDRSDNKFFNLLHKSKAFYS